MDFYLHDLTDEAKERVLKNNKNVTEDEPIAISFNYNDTKNCTHVSGKYEFIQKLIPILKGMGYDDFHLYYEDCGIWTLCWHNPEFNGPEWMLVR